MGIEFFDGSIEGGTSGYGFEGWYVCVSEKWMIDAGKKGISGVSGESIVAKDLE